MLCNELNNSTRRPQSNFQMDCKELDNIINRYCVLNNVHIFIVLPVVVRYIIISNDTSRRKHDYDV